MRLCQSVHPRGDVGLHLSRPGFGHLQQTQLLAEWLIAASYDSNYWWGK